MNKEPGGGDLVVVGARVRTLDSSRPRASAFVIRGGRVVHVGDAASSRAAADASAPVLECGDRTVTPGLTDGHTHLAAWARAHERLSLAGAGSLDEALARVAAAHQRLAPGKPLTGDGVPPFGAWGRPPARGDLDRAAPGRAVVLRARDRHAAWVSTAALAAAGVTRATADPPGGVIARDADGEPSGLLYENALRMLGADEGALDRGALAAAIARLSAVGITSVHDFGDRVAWDALAALLEDESLDLRVAFGWMVGGFGGAALEDALPPAHALVPGERLWSFALKGFVDGTLGSRTAWMIDPFEDGSGCGVPTSDAAALDRLARHAKDLGLGLALHAIGDRATHAALDAFARWPASSRRPFHARIEHAQLVHQGDLPRFRQLAVVASMQPLHAATDRELAERLWGARNAAGGYAWSALLAAGARLVFGSDVPIEDPDPRAGLWAAVTGGDEPAWRHGATPSRALTLDDAFHAFTAAAAWSVGREQTLGRLAPGMHADFVVWEEDPWSVAADRLRGVPIASTWVGGRQVWPRV